MPSTDSLASPPPGSIPVAGPWISPLEVEYVTKAVQSAWYAHASNFHQQFERAFAARVDRRFSIALPSCTSALHLALAALGIGPGDEVVVPDTTWIATAAPISYVGATPVFADVDRQHWCITPEAIESCVSARTKAVIVVDLYGNMPDMSAVLDVTARRGIPVIEDAAEAIGSRYRGRPAGSFGLVSTFSFHGSKTLTTGEGGMLLTDDSRLYERCRILQDHGRAPGPRMFWNAEVGYKYKMSALQAALGLAQLERLDELVARKRQIFGWYRDRLQHIPGLALNPEPGDVFNSYWMSTVVWDERYQIGKDAVISGLKERRIDSRPFFYPLSQQPAYQSVHGVSEASLRNAGSRWLNDRAINLPSAMSLTEEQVDTVVRALRQILAVS